MILILFWTNYIAVKVKKEKEKSDFHQIGEIPTNLSQGLTHTKANENPHKTEEIINSFFCAISICVVNIQRKEDIEE